MVKKLNGFLLTRKLNHKCLVKVRPFNSAKVRCMHDHAKPTVRDFDPDHIILHCRTNDLNSDRTSSQIAKEIIDLALSLKSEKNRISVSLLTPRSDKLNNKANEVNNRLINMCCHRNIAYIDHSSSIQQNQINESKVHLNRYGTIVFANTFSKFLSEYYRWGHDNSNKIHLVQDIYNKELKSYLQESDKENQTSVSNSIETLNEVTFESEESVLSNQSTLSTLDYESISDPFGKLKNTRLKNPNRLIIAQLNINSLRNKFDSLVRTLHNNLDILLISETKIDSSFPTAQFQIEGYTTYRLDRNANGGGILLYIREDIPSTLLNFDMSIESIFIEINIRKKKWLLVGTYNPNKNLISNHLKEIGKNLDNYSSK